MSKIDLYSTIDEKGDWWLPESPAQKIRGRFNFDPIKGPLLHLDGSFYDFNTTFNQNYKNPDVIIGSLDNGKYVTLFKNIITNIRGQMMADKPEVTIYSNQVLYGIAPEPDETLKFTECTIRFQFLETWFATNVFEYEHFRKETTPPTITYNRPEEFEVEIKGKFNIGSNSWLSSGSLPAFNEARFEHHRELIIKTDIEYPVEWFLDQVWNISQLISILAGSKKQITKINFPLKVKYDERTEVPHDVILLYKPEPLKKNKPPHPAMMIFPYPNIKNRFDEVLQRWLTLKEKADDSVNLFFDSHFRSGSFSHYKYLAATQACESLHRELTGIKEKNHKDRMIELFERLPDKIKKSLIKDESLFFQKALDTRNYFTHYDKKKKDKSFAGAELLWVTRKINWIFIFILFQELGFKNEEIEKRIQNDQDFISTCKTKII